MNKAAADEISETFCRSLAAATAYDDPYQHFYADGLLPEPVVDALARLPTAAPSPAHFSGKRDQANATRFYVNAATMARFPILHALAEALQSAAVARTIATLCDAPLHETYLRIEYAVDRDGFWLEPHTDLGEKKFTGLISLAESGQDELGTDIYVSKHKRAKRAPFRRSGALMFVPGNATWHGFEKRRIEGLRRSLILNYVGPQWRARDQLAFPDQPVALTQSAQ